MAHKPLFGKLIAKHDGLAEELKSVGIAADLALLLHHTGRSRADLARALDWSRARVTQVLSGDENLTVQTIAAVTEALGYTFDASFRKVGEPAAIQPWQKQAVLELELDGDMDELRGWMSRKTMTKIDAKFAGAQEFTRTSFSVDAANHYGVLLEA